MAVDPAQTSALPSLVESEFYSPAILWGHLPVHSLGESPKPIQSRLLKAEMFAAVPLPITDAPNLWRWNGYISIWCRLNVFL